MAYEAGGVDQVTFAAGIGVDDVKLFEPTNGYSTGGIGVISADGSVSVAFQQWQMGLDYQIEQFVFADGAVLSKDAMLARGVYKLGTAGNDALDGFGGVGLIFDGMGGNDTYSGTGHADTYLFSAGAGHDSVYESGGIDRIQFGAGIGATEVVAFEANGGNGDLGFRLLDGSASITLCSGYTSDVRKMPAL